MSIIFSNPLRPDPPPPLSAYIPPLFFLPFFPRSIPHVSQEAKIVHRYETIARRARANFASYHPAENFLLTNEGVLSRHGLFSEKANAGVIRRANLELQIYLPRWRGSRGFPIKLVERDANGGGSTLYKSMLHSSKLVF